MFKKKSYIGWDINDSLEAYGGEDKITSVALIGISKPYMRSLFHTHGGLYAYNVWTRSLHYHIKDAETNENVGMLGIFLDEDNPRAAAVQKAAEELADNYEYLRDGYFITSVFPECLNSFEDSKLVLVFDGEFDDSEVVSVYWENTGLLVGTLLVEYTEE